MHTCWTKGALALLAIIFAWTTFSFAPILVTLAIILMFVSKDQCQDCSMKKAKSNAPRKVVKAARKKSRRRR